MVFPKARLVVSGGLFLAWIGVLVYLVARTRDPVIISRPQFLAAHLHVVAHVEEKDGLPAPKVAVKKVLWSDSKGDEDLSSLTLDDLPDCGPANGWRGADDYLLAVSRTADSRYRVTPLPWSPGFVPAYDALELRSIGPQPDKVAPLIAQFTGWSEAKSRAFTRGVLKRNIHRHEHLQVKEQLKEAGADVDWIKEETRIYLANPDALAQWEEIRP